VNAVDGIATITLTSTTTPGTATVRALVKDVPPSGGKTVDVPVVGGKITGKVTKRDGTTPVVGATVQAFATGTTAPVLAEATTGSDGRYTLSNLGSGVYDVTASPAGYLPQTVVGRTVTAPNETANVNFSLSKAPTQLGGGKAEPASIPADGKSTSVISVELLDADGQKVLAATNKVTFSVTQGSNSVTLPAQTEVTPVNGVASLTVTATTTPGNVTIKATAAGLGETTIPLTVTGTSVSGKVTRYADGGGESGVTVKALLNGVEKGRATTDAGGNYTLTGLGSGEYDLKAEKADYVPSLRPDVKVEANTPTAGQDFVLVNQPAAFGGVDLVTIPFTFADPTASVVLGNKTRVARYNGSSYDYIGLQVAPGRGFWTKPDPDLFHIVAPGTLAPQDQKWKIPLSASGNGWNMVGSPFLKPVNWGTVQVETNSGTVGLLQAGQQQLIYPFAWGYDPASGSYQLIAPEASLPGLNISGTQLVPWRGYWVRVRGTAALVIQPPSRSMDEGEGREARAGKGGKPGPGEWTVQLVAQAGSLRDTDNYCGVNATALPETRAAEGDLRVESPPPMSPFVDLFFTDGSGTGGRYALDLRKRSAERMAWDLAVETDAAEEVVLTWPNLRQVPAGVQLTLIDLETGERIPLRSRAAYRYRPFSESRRSSSLRRFRLEAARRPASLTITGLTAIPTRGGGVSIAFTLTEAAQVQAEVVTLNGRRMVEVATPQSRAAGLNNLVWDGRDAQGRLVPNGVYLFRVVATTEAGECVQAIRTVRVAR